MKNFLVCRDTKVTSNFNEQDLDRWQKDCFFRFQCLDWEVGDKSFGMIYSTPEEAMEEGSTVLDGKSCCGNWRDLRDHLDSFDEEYFCVLVFKGTHNGYGHDGEDVAIPEEFVAALDMRHFLEILLGDDYIG